MLRAALAVGMASIASGGCQNDNGAVLLHVMQSVGVSASFTSYSSSSAAVSFFTDGRILFTATSNEGVLTVLVPGPLVTGATIQLGADQERVHFEVGGAGWGNQGGAVVVLSADPAIIRLAGVPMVARSGSASGSFVFFGDGTFR